MLQIKNLSLSHSLNHHKLIEDFSFSLNKREKIALISEEGNGKSTLLKAIVDSDSISDYIEMSGEIILTSSMGYLPQFFQCEQTVSDYLGEIAYYNQFNLEIDVNQTFNSLSGGEKIKVQLLKLLHYEPEILILDEPSNDLDIETLIWLEKFIQSFSGSILFVSHDEMLLRRCATGIIHLEQLVKKTQPKHTIVRMSYDDYVRQRESLFSRNMMIANKQRAQHRAKTARHQQLFEKVHHQQNTISRQNPAGGRLLKKKMKTIKAQEKRLHKEEESFVVIPQQEEAVFSEFNPTIKVPHGKTIVDLNLQNLSVNNRVLVNRVQLFVSGPQKVGIIGRNGIGKSTLLKKIKELFPHFGYMSQNYFDLLSQDLNPIDFLAHSQMKDEITKVRQYLGAMKFTRAEMVNPIIGLSGGQQAKILLLKMVLDENEVLLLDEPTRNFSPLTNPVLRDAFINFGGSIIAISHDRQFLVDVCDVIYELKAEGLVRVEKETLIG